VRPRRLAALPTLLLAAACWAPGPVAMAPPTRARLPVPLALVVSPGAADAAVTPTTPVGTGEAAARAAATAALGPLAGALAGAWVCSAGNPSSDAGAAAFIICGPVGAVVGGLGGLAVGARLIGESGRTEDETRAGIARIEALMAPRRLAACLRETLLRRAGGRLAPGLPDATEALEVRLATVSLAPSPAGGVIRPVMVLAVKVESRVRGPAPPADAVAWSPPLPGGSWTFRSPPQGWTDWAARDAALVAAELDVGLGLVAQSILADAYPRDFAAPAAEGRDETLRTACPAPPAAG
jgi:hypothetical protein